MRTEKDALDTLAAGILRDCAKTTEKLRPLAKTAGWTLDETLDRLVKLLNDSAAKHE